MSFLGKAAAISGVALIALSVQPEPAMAGDGHRHWSNSRHHGWQDDRRHRHHHQHYYHERGPRYRAPPHVYYAPPPVYYAPPAYYAQPQLNFVLPLRF